MSNHAHRRPGGLPRLRPQPPLTMETPLGTFRQPLGERGSATNPLGPRARRRGHWVPATAQARARGSPLGESLMGERVGTFIGLAIVLLLLVGSIGYCSKVHDECDREGGVVVKNYYDLPECIEEGQH